MSRDPASHGHEPGGVARWLGWLVAPTFLYLVGFVMLTGLVLCMYNPDWGAQALAWPHQVFTEGGAFAWTTSAAKAAALLSTLGCLVVALLWRPGPTRGAIALLGASIGLVAFQVPPDDLSFWILPLASGIVTGALLVPAGPRQRAVLLVGLAVVAANLLLPWDEMRVTSRNIEPGYHSTASAQLDLLLDPPDEMMYELTETGEATDTRRPIQGYARIVMMTLPQTMGLLMLVLGLVSLAGLGRSWVRWVAAPALLLLAIAPAWVLYDHGSYDLTTPGQPWQLGLRYWAGVWTAHGAAWVLPLAGAVAELSRRREP